MFLYRKSIFLPFLILLLIAGCEDYEDEKRQTSAGGVDEVLIIVDDQFLKTDLTDTLAYYFSQSFPVLPQPEPNFDVMIRSYTQFSHSELIQNHRNIIFVAPLNSEGKVSSIIKERLGDENILRAQEDTSFYFAIQKNVFARPQLVIYAFAPTKEELIDRFVERKSAIFDLISKSEIEKLEGALYYSGTNKAAIEKIKNKFGISLKIPNNYTVINEADDHLRLVKEQYYRDQQDNIVKEIKQNLVIHSFDLDSINIEAIKDSLISARGLNVLPYALRDSMGKKYIGGVAENFYMYSDKIRPLYQDSMMIDGKRVIQSRGLWRMDNPWMGGPYINYTIFDMANNQVIILDGFIYAAGSKKRRLLREIESILSTLEFQESK